MQRARFAFALIAFAWSHVVTAGVQAPASDGTLFFDYQGLRELAETGLTIEAGGTYHVWIWGKGPELKITIGEEKFEVSSKDRFGWHRPGQIVLEKGMRPSVLLPKNESDEDVTNIPGYLALSTDPAFDPKRHPLGGLRTLYDASGFKPPGTKNEWLKRRESLRRQILISAGLWPMPPKADLEPQIYGKQIRDGYTIEKVVLETMPGFYLSGNLYRPAPWVPVQDEPKSVKDQKAAWEKNRAAEKKPGILCPHGHWRYGRFEPEVQKRCKQLARMGSVVFAYDMVGYADSKDFGHKFLDPQIDLMGFSLFGLQTWNSIRALDFLTQLPDVDLERVACTGASGGGTQTFVLAAIDDRLQVVAPTVMVSQDMQGGCACENASGFRIGTDNSEIAALFAPKPQIMVCCTGDWTKEFPTKGFPEVQAIYSLFDAGELVETDIFDFPHNYNQTTRERVYAFFAKHLFHIDPAQSKELPLEAESSETISTWDAEHPRPKDAATVDTLKKYLADVVAEQAMQFRPADRERWGSMREELATALATRLAVNATHSKIRVEDLGRRDWEGYVAWSARLGSGPRIPVQSIASQEKIDEKPNLVTLVVHPDGVNGLMAADSPGRVLVTTLNEKGHVVVGMDPYLVGSNQNPFAKVAPSAVTHFTCYNRSTAAARVQDIVTVLNYLKQRVGNAGRVNLVGIGSAGPLCLLARTQTPFVAQTVIDANQFDYKADAELASEQVLPGILRLGGLRSVGSLVAPGRLVIHNSGDGLDTSWIEEAYRLDEATDKLKVQRSLATHSQILAALAQ